MTAESAMPLATSEWAAFEFCSEHGASQVVRGDIFAVFERCVGLLAGAPKRSPSGAHWCPGVVPKR